MLNSLKLPFGLCLTKSSLDMLSDLPRNRARYKSPCEKDNSIHTDIGLRDWSRYPNHGRSPTQVQSGGNVANSCDASGENADPRVQPQCRKNNEDEEDKNGGTRQRSICNLNVFACQKRHSECRD